MIGVEMTPVFKYAFLNFLRKRKAAPFAFRPQELKNEDANEGDFGALPPVEVPAEPEGIKLRPRQKLRLEALTAQLPEINTGN